MKTWSLTRVAGTQAPIVGRSGFSNGALRAAKSSVHVLKPAAWTSLSMSSFLAYAGWNFFR